MRFNSFIRYGWLVLLVVLIFGIIIGCESENDRPGVSVQHLPSGWRIEPGRCQMLARSYPSFEWLSLILRFGGRSQHLFSTPYPAPPHSQSFLFFGQRRSNRPPPPGILGQPTPEPKPQKRVVGFSFFFRSNHPITLEIRLPLRHSNSALKQVYRTSFQLPKTGQEWERHNFLYSEFVAIDPANTSPNIDPYAVSHIEFWEVPTPQKARSSVTLTIKEPILYRSKKAPSTLPSSLPSTLPSSLPSTLPSSLPASE